VIVTKAKAAETIRPALETRLRMAGIEPQLAPLPAPDMRVSDPKKRAKLHAKAIRNVQHGNASAMAKALDAAKSPWFGCTAGRAIATVPALRRALAGDADVPTLWDAIQRIRGIYQRYLNAIGAPSPYASGMNLELLPEDFGTDGVEVDVGEWDGRTEEERVKAATAAMMHVEGVLGRAGEGVLVEVKAVVLRDERVRHMDRLIVGLAAVVKEA
jgi:hypothetical protein